MNNNTDKKKRKYKRPGQILTKKCIDFLKKHGYLVQRNNTGIIFINNRAIRMGTPGSPDIVGCTPTGRFIGIECKSDRDRLSDKQLSMKKEIENRNGIYLIIKSIDDLKKIIEEDLE